jgi:predicted GIY-YIG superfamily endonuclease
MKNTFYIYCLICPIDSSIKYIGMSINPDVRLQMHYNGTESSEEKYNWINNLKSVGVKPIMKIIDTSNSRTKAKKLEKYYISKYVADGHLLLNGKMNSRLPNLRKGVSREMYYKLIDEANKLGILTRDHFNNSLKNSIK